MHPTTRAGFFFKKLRDHERHSKMGKLGPLAMYSFMSGCGEVERWELFQPTQTLDSERFAQHEQSADRLRQSTFRHNAFDFSLGEDVLHKLRTTNRTWPALTPKQWAESAVATLLLRHAGEQRNPSIIKNAFQCSMVSEGTVLRRSDFRASRAQYLFVVRTTPYGLLTWPLKRARPRNSGPICCTFDLTAKLTPVFIVKHADWLVSNVDAKSPLSMAKILAPCDNRCGGGNGGIVLVPSGRPMSLACHSALTGFKGLTSQYLQSLARLEGLRFAGRQRPTRVEHWVRALYKHFMGEADEADVLAALQRRGLPRAPHIYDSLIVDPADKDMVQDGFDSDDTRQV